MAWTDKRVDLLKKYWGEGYSASQVAYRLGGVSRNAVIGKVHRLKLPKRTKESNRGFRRTALRPDAVLPDKVHRYSIRTMWTAEKRGLLIQLWPTSMPWQEIRDIIDPQLSNGALRAKAKYLGVRRGNKGRIPGRVPLLETLNNADFDRSNPPREECKTIHDLEHGDCRYIIGETQPDEPAYCGRETVKGKSWCPKHYEQCHQKQTPRYTHNKNSGRLTSHLAGVA